MIVEKGYQGQLIISDIINGYWVSRQYFGYTKREAVRKFKLENKEVK